MFGVVDVYVYVNEFGRISWEGYIIVIRVVVVGGIIIIVDMLLLVFC